LGHGNVSVDPIHDLPHLGSTFDEIFELELVPYRGEYLPDSIMAAHIVYDKIDNVFPASMSQKILKEILRNNLNYNGLIVTDCYESGGLQRAFSLPEAAVFSVKATADMILISHNLGKQLMVRNALLEAVNKNYIDLNIIDQAIKRILSTKAKYTKPTELDVDYNRNQIVAHEISLASITIASGKLFEIDKNTVVVGITNYSFPIIEESYVDKLDIAKELGLAFNIPYYSLNNKSFNLNNIIQVCKEKKVILALIDSHITLAQKVLYTTLVQNNNHIMLISMGTPYDILELSKPECHVCLYEYTTLSISSLIRVLKGEPAKGKLPVNISSPLDFKKINSLNVIVKKVLIKLNAQYANEISLDSVALEQNITASHLSRLFKKEMGMTFSEYLMNLRINKAKNLLVTSSLYIYEIANLCGFQDFNYFSKVFKKVTGVTPNDYRNHHYEYNY
jgi:beta-N-acetylhexosaminidase